jgi:aryl-alcohol dehydrogenase-like predicted oxidoreductase
MALIERVILGTRPFTQIREKEIFSILEYFFSQGGQYVDTSYFYGYGKVEKIIGKFIKTYNPKILLISKIGYFNNLEDYKDINKINLAIERTCENLFFTPNYILLHEADWKIWWSKAGQLDQLIELDDFKNLNFELYYKFNEILDKLSILGGISGNNANIIQKLLFLKPKIVLLSKQYDLLWKNAQPLIFDSMRSDFSLILGAPFHQSWILRLNELSKKNPQISKEIRQLNKIVSNHSYTLKHIALNFIVQTTECKIAFGVENKRELDENLRNLITLLPDNLIEELKKIRVFLPPLPGPLMIQRSI